MLLLNMHACLTACSAATVMCKSNPHNSNNLGPVHTRVCAIGRNRRFDRALSAAALTQGRKRTRSCACYTLVHTNTARAGLNPSLWPPRIAKSHSAKPLRHSAPAPQPKCALSP